MKKLIAMLLALAMVFAMAACGATENVETEPATEATTEATEIVTEEATEEVTEEIVEEEDFVIELTAMETLLNSIVEIQPVEFMGMAMPVDLADADAVKYFTGLDGVKEAAVFEPMIGSIAFSMVAVQVEEGTDAAAVAEAMKTGIDTRKWICVEANDLMVATSGDVALLVMVDSNNGLTAQSFVDAFNTVVAG